MRPPAPPRPKQRAQPLAGQAPPGAWAVRSLAAPCYAADSVEAKIPVRHVGCRGGGCFPQSAGQDPGRLFLRYFLLGSGWFQGCGTFGAGNVRLGCTPPAGPQWGLHPGGWGLQWQPHLPHVGLPGAPVREAFLGLGVRQSWNLVGLDRGLGEKIKVRQQNS